MFGHLFSCHLMWPTRPRSSEGYYGQAQKGCGLSVAVGFAVATIIGGVLWLLLG